MREVSYNVNVNGNNVKVDSYQKALDLANGNNAMIRTELTELAPMPLEMSAKRKAMRISIR